MESLEQKIVLLDEPLDRAKKIGSGAYAVAYKLKVHGAACIGKRIHDILTGTSGCEPVPKEQWEPLIDKFEKECMTLSELRHPNVVQFIGIHRPTSDPRDLVLVMEMLFTDLDKFVKQYHDIPLPIKLHVLKNVTCGLLYLHSRHTMHRDLNAGNVLITEDLQAKLADFGVSRILEQQLLKSRPLSVMPGAPDYMPPEAETEYTFKLDCFSLGHLALYLVIQKYPKPRRLTAQEVRQSDIPLEIQRRLSWIDQIDKGHCLYQTIVNCLQDKPDDRPQMADIHKKFTDLSQAQPKTLAMVADVLEKGKSVVVQSLLELEQLREQVKQSSLLTKKHATEYQQQIHDLQQQLQKAKQQSKVSKELASPMECNNSKEKEMEQLKTNVKELENELAIILAQAMTYKADFEEERRDRERIKGQVVDVEEQATAKANKLHAAINELNTQNQQLRTQLEGVLNENLRLKEKYKKSKAKKTAILKQVDELKEELETSQAQIRGYKTQSDGLKKELKESKQATVEGLQRSSEIQQKVADLEKELDSEKKSHEHLRAAFGFATAIGDQLKANNAQLEEKVREKTREKEVLVRENSKMKSSNVTLMKKLTAAKEDNKELQEHVCRLEEQIVHPQHFAHPAIPSKTYPNPRHQQQSQPGILQPHSQLPQQQEPQSQFHYDPNLTCLKCGTMFKYGEIQKCRKHYDECGRKQ